MKVRAHIVITTEINREDFIEDDEDLTDADVMERFGEQIDDGSLSMDDLGMNDASEIDIRVLPAIDGQPHWRNALSHGEVALIDEMVPQIPEQVRDVFIGILAKLHG
jgi:hypothetical protein